MKKWISMLLLISVLMLTGCSDADVNVYVEDYPAEDIYYDYSGDIRVSDLGITQSQLWYYDSFEIWEPATEYVQHYTAIDDDYCVEVYSSTYSYLILLRVGDIGYFRVEDSDGIIDEFYCPVNCSDYFLTLGDAALDFAMNTEDMILVDEGIDTWTFETISDPGMTVTVNKDTYGITHIVNYYDNDVKVAPLDYYPCDVDEFEYADYYDEDVDGIIDNYLTSLLFTGYFD